MIKIIIGVAVATIIGIIALTVIPQVTRSNEVPTQVVDGPNKLTIGITGEVVKPGNYILDEGSTLQDLIDKAGGTNNNADDRAYFLDLEVLANEEYYIPPKYDLKDVCSESPIEKVNINEADKESLLQISGVGEAVSTQLIAYRNDNGVFRRLEDIKNVSGIGNATFEKVKNYSIDNALEISRQLLLKKATSKRKSFFG